MHLAPKQLSDVALALDNCPPSIPAVASTTGRAASIAFDSKLHPTVGTFSGHRPAVRNRICGFGRGLLGLATLGSLAGAQTEQAGLFAQDGAAGDAFGISVSVRQSTIAVGAKFADDNGAYSGAAYVYERGAGGWLQQAKLIGADTSQGDTFGLTVTNEKDTVVVGAPSDDDNGTFSGSAYVFQRKGTSWSQAQKLIAPDGTGFDRFGLSLAIEGNTLAVGAPLDQLVGPQSGSVYLYAHTPSGWEFAQKLVPQGHQPWERFGEALSIHDGTLVIGAFGDAAGLGVRTGAAYVFVPNGGGYSQQQELFASDGAVDDEFGVSVSFDGQFIAIGAPGADQGAVDAGAVYVFEHDGSSWVQRQKLLASDAQAGDAFGRSVSVQDGRIAVGAYLSGEEAGSTYVFALERGSWAEEVHLSARDTAPGDWTGWSLGMDAGTLVVGAHFNDELGDDAGTATVFSLESSFRSLCAGDGSATACPCGNASAPLEGQGCANSSGEGALLVGTGSSSYQVDDLVFDAFGVPVGEISILFCGDELVRDGMGKTMGDGLRCAGGQLVRFPVQVNATSGGVQFGPGLGAYAGWGAGELRRFQLWYRDQSPSAPCGIGFNLSNVVETMITP